MGVANVSPVHEHLTVTKPVAKVSIFSSVQVAALPHGSGSEQLIMRWPPTTTREEGSGAVQPELLIWRCRKRSSAVSAPATCISELLKPQAGDIVRRSDEKVWPAPLLR